MSKVLWEVERIQMTRHCKEKLSMYCLDHGPWWYGRNFDGPYCEKCFTIYFQKHKDELTLSGQGGISSSLQRIHFENRHEKVPNS